MNLKASSVQRRVGMGTSVPQGHDSASSDFLGRFAGRNQQLAAPSGRMMGSRHGGPGVSGRGGATARGGTPDDRSVLRGVRVQDFRPPAAFCPLGIAEPSPGNDRGRGRCQRPVRRRRPAQNRCPTVPKPEPSLFGMGAGCSRHRPSPRHSPRPPATVPRRDEKIPGWSACSNRCYRRPLGVVAPRHHRPLRASQTAPA